MVKHEIQWLNGIYFLQFPNDEKIYIGATKTSFRERYIDHLQKLKTQKHHNKELQNLYNKHKSFSMFILETELETTLQLKRAEKKWIKHFQEKTYNKKSRSGVFNLGQPSKLFTIWQVRNTQNGRKLICHNPFSNHIQLKQKLEKNEYPNKLLQTDFTTNPNDIVFEIVANVKRRDFQKTLYLLKKELLEEDYGKQPVEFPISLYSLECPKTPLDATGAKYTTSLYQIKSIQ